MYKETYHSGCKINLSLSITGILKNGYHTIDSLFWPLKYPCDTLDFCAKHGQEFIINCNIKDIDINNNTLTKAYDAFIKAGGQIKPEYGAIHVNLTKNIPHGAGLGGGSSNAASVLLWCNKHAIEPLEQNKLLEVALQVGADVPFFLINTPAHIQGIGEKIESLAYSPIQHYAILICPNIYISTPWAYKSFDEEKKLSYAKKLLTKSKHIYTTLFVGEGYESIQFSNDFENVVFTLHPALKQIKHDLLSQGALFATMSGSGSAIVGVVRRHEEAIKIAEYFKSDDCKTFVSSL